MRDAKPLDLGDRVAILCTEGSSVMDAEYWLRRYEATVQALEVRVAALQRGAWQPTTTTVYSSASSTPPRHAGHARLLTEAEIREIERERGRRL